MLHRKEVRKLRNAKVDTRRFELHNAESDFGRMAIPAIRRKHVRAHVDALLLKEEGGKHIGDRERRTLSNATVRHCLNQIRHILDQAVEDEIISSNPAMNMKLARADEAEADEDMSESFTFLALEEQTRM